MEKISVKTFDELMFSGGKYIPAYMIFASYGEDCEALEQDIAKYLEKYGEGYIHGCLERDLCIESDPVKRVKMADYHFITAGGSVMLKYDTAEGYLKEHGYIRNDTLLMMRVEDCKTVAEFKAKVDAEKN